MSPTEIIAAVAAERNMFPGELTGAGGARGVVQAREEAARRIAAVHGHPTADRALQRPVGWSERVAGKLKLEDGK